MVSIIVPAYNAERRINACLHSILTQTFQEWECLVIDDGSTDSTGGICDLFMKKDSRFKVFHQSNQGVSASRNLGIAKARGEYICFVDSDDSVGAQYVEHLADVIGDADLAVSGIKQYGNKGDAYELKPQKTTIFALDQTGEALFLQLNKAELLFPPFVKLYKTNIVQSHSIAFPVDCSYGEDLQFVYHYLDYVNKIATVDSVDYFYLMAEGNSLSTMKRRNAFDEDYKQWKILREFYEKKDFKSEGSMKFLYYRLFGIIYNELFSLDSAITLHQIRKVLSVPEISFMRPFLSNYPCSIWIKELVLRRNSFMFLLYLKMMKRNQ